MSGAGSITTERQRQMVTLGWTPDHDDHHDGGELLCAAVAFIACAAPEIGPAIAQAFENEGDNLGAGYFWPWRYEFSPDTPVQCLIKAGALIAAEIDRLRRAGVRL